MVRERDTEYETGVATSDDDLRQILALQSANHADSLTEADRREHGFVTLKHDLSLLRDSGKPWPHIVARTAGGAEVVAYALIILHELRDRFPDLDPMYGRLGRVEYRGRPVLSWRSYVMGQICVAPRHRGRGLVQRLYDEHCRRMSPRFDLMITEIARLNRRSLRAHEKAGFMVLDRYRSPINEEWVIVALDLSLGGG